MNRLVHQTLSKELVILSARSTLYKVLALGFRYPSYELLKLLTGGELLAKLRSATEELATTSLADRAGALAEDMGRISGLEQLESEYNSLFAPGVERNCTLYETEYGSSGTFTKVHEMADVAGFYAAFGMQIGKDDRERPDHAGVELEFMHHLTLKEAYAGANGLKSKASLCRDAERKFARDHLAKWLPSLCKLIRSVSRTGFYASLAALTEGFLNFEVGELDVEIPKISTELPMLTPMESLSCPADCSPPSP